MWHATYFLKNLNLKDIKWPNYAVDYVFSVCKSMLYNLINLICVSSGNLDPVLLNAGPSANESLNSQL